VKGLRSPSAHCPSWDYRHPVEHGSSILTLPGRHWLSRECLCRDMGTGRVHVGSREGQVGAEAKPEKFLREATLLGACICPRASNRSTTHCCPCQGQYLLVQLLGRGLVERTVGNRSSLATAARTRLVLHRRVRD
jgi:hypothetical protein